MGHFAGAMQLAPRSILILVFTLMTAAFMTAVPRVSAAQDADQSSDVADDSGNDSSADTVEESGPPELIQSVKSKELGQLSLPGFWDVSEIADGVRAVETRSERPAAIEVAAIPMPGLLPAASVSGALLEELEQQSGKLELLVEEELGENGSEESKSGLDQLYVELRLTESGTSMRYGYIVVAGDKKAIIASLGAPDERFDAFEARALLQEILASITE